MPANQTLDEAIRVLRANAEAAAIGEIRHISPDECCAVADALGVLPPTPSVPAEDIAWLTEHAQLGYSPSDYPEAERAEFDRYQRILSALQPSPLPSGGTREAVAQAINEYGAAVEEYFDDDYGGDADRMHTAYKALLALFDAPPRGEAAAHEQEIASILGVLSVYVIGEESLYDTLNRVLLDHQMADEYKAQNVNLRAALTVPRAGEAVPRVSEQVLADLRSALHTRAGETDLAPIYADHVPQILAAVEYVASLTPALENSNDKS